jgi:hypothetical protein
MADWVSVMVTGSMLLVGSKYTLTGTLPGIWLSGMDFHVPWSYTFQKFRSLFPTTAAKSSELVLENLPPSNT